MGTEEGAKAKTESQKIEDNAGRLPLQVMARMPPP